MQNFKYFENIEYIHINLIIDILKTGGALSLGGDATAVVKQNIFRIVSNDNKELFLERNIVINSEFVWNKKKYSVKEKLFKNDEEKQFYLDPSLNFNNAIFRLRQSGDKFTYPFRKITKPLRKALNEMKIPSELRDSLLVLAIDNQILWCEGLGVSLQGLCKDDSSVGIRIDISQN